MISLFNEDIMALRIYTRAVKPAENDFITYPDTIWKKILVLMDKCNNAIDDGFEEVEIRHLQDKLAEAWYGKAPKE